MLNRERLIQDFIKLVGVPCRSKEEGQIGALVAAELEAIGYAYEWDHVEKITGGECGNIIVTLPATPGLEGSKGLFFEAHMDSVDPCTGTKVIRKEGVLRSDGTTVLGGDDKVGVASMLEVLRSLREDPLPHGLLQFFFTVSEEVGCWGAKYADKNLIKADFGYCLDTHGHLGEIVNQAPEQFVYDVVVTGKAAHAGVEPEKGVSAIMLAAQALAALPKYGRIDEETTLNVGLVQGGAAYNIVAAHCDFSLDMRSLNSEKLHGLRDGTFKTLKAVVEAGGGSIGFVMKEGCPPAVVDAEHPCVQLARRSAENLEAQVQLERSGGCSDGNYYCGMGYPTVCLGTGMSNIHTTEEFLAEDDLFNTARWLLEIVKLSGE